MLALAPVVPLGTHSALATVSQHKVLSTIRACEVAADPTNALALEAAGRRRALPRTATVKLAGIQRVVRAQQFQGAGAPAHFTLFGLVTAGRDEGSYGLSGRRWPSTCALPWPGWRSPGCGTSTWR